MRGAHCFWRRGSHMIGDQTSSARRAAVGAHRALVIGAPARFVPFDFSCAFFICARFRFSVFARDCSRSVPFVDRFPVQHVVDHDDARLPFGNFANSVQPMLRGERVRTLRFGSLSKTLFSRGSFRRAPAPTNARRWCGGQRRSSSRLDASAGQTRDALWRASDMVRPSDDYRRQRHADRQQRAA